MHCQKSYQSYIIICLNYFTKRNKDVKAKVKCACNYKNWKNDCTAIKTKHLSCL